MNSSDKVTYNGVEYEFTPYRAAGICEGFEPTNDEEEVIAAWQYLINTGLCWCLQGWFGRTARDMIEGGICQTKEDYDRNRE